jgi:signal transduction histidine kinase
MVWDDSSLLFFTSDRDGYWLFLEPPRAPAWAPRLWLMAVVLALCYFLADISPRLCAVCNTPLKASGKGTSEPDRVRSAVTSLDSWHAPSIRWRGIQRLVENQRELLRDISHEFRSPLTRLGLAVAFPTAKEEALNTIEKEADRLNQLVGERLSLARIENQESAAHRSIVELDEMLEDLVEICSVEAVPRNCSLVLTSETPVTIEADEELVRRAVENVIRNALRYSPENTEVNVMLARSNGMSSIRVRDAGPGIPTESLTGIFEPFYRVDQARNRETGGTGLGLVIAYRAIRIHGGEIVARNVSPGLEVEIQLPVIG